MRWQSEARIFALLLSLVALAMLGCLEPDHSLIPPAQPVEVTSGLTDGDTFEVRVFGEEELGGVYQVQEDGTIVFPLVGRVEVAGKTQYEVGSLLEEALGNGYLRDPHVTVVLIGRENLEVSVLGQVQRPGTFPYVEKLTLVQAISEAGGLNELAHARRVKLTRKGPDGVGTYDVSVKAITEGRAEDILLQPGDIIFVPLAPI
jgi:protein involved in polysaccharide export with SLBB domain